MKKKIAAKKKFKKKIQNIVITSSLIYYLPGKNTQNALNQTEPLFHTYTQNKSFKYAHLLLSKIILQLS